MGSICISQIQQWSNEQEGEQKINAEQNEEPKNILYSEYYNLDDQQCNVETCLEKLREINEIFIQFKIKEISDQREFLKQQIQKPLLDLQSQKFESVAVKEFLNKYCFFLEQISANSPEKMSAWWSANQSKIVSVDEALSYWNQQIIVQGGKLRYEIALKGLEVVPPTAERFVKTREWIKKQNDADVGEEGEENQDLCDKLK